MEEPTVYMQYSGVSHLPHGKYTVWNWPIASLDEKNNLKNSLFQRMLTNEEKQMYSLNFFIQLFFKFFLRFALRNKCLRMSYE